MMHDMRHLQCLNADITPGCYISKEQRFPYANAILCKLLHSENSRVFRYLSTVDFYLLACYVLVLSLIVILFCF